MTDFFDDVDDILEAQKKRKYKDYARSIMDKKTLIKTSNFKKTLNRWIRENKIRDAISQGQWTPPRSSNKTDWAKVSYTILLQLINLTIVTLCITIGVWHVIILTIPVLITLNIYWLIKDNGDNENRR